MGFRVQGLGFRVQGSGFRGSGFRGLGFRVWGLGFRVQGSGFSVWGSGFGVQGLGFRVQQLRSSSFSVQLHSQLRHNTHPPLESHNIEKLEVRSFTSLPSPVHVPQSPKP